MWNQVDRRASGASPGGYGKKRRGSALRRQTAVMNAKSWAQGGWVSATSVALEKRAQVTLSTGASGMMAKVKVLLEVQRVGTRLESSQEKIPPPQRTLKTEKKCRTGGERKGRTGDAGPQDERSPGVCSESSVELGQGLQGACFALGTVPGTK